MVRSLRDRDVRISRDTSRETIGCSARSITSVQWCHYR
jgi:hypothetical protein